MIDLEKKPQSAGGIISVMKSIFMKLPADRAMAYIRKVYAEQDGMSVLYCSWGTEHPTLDQNELMDFLGVDRYIKVRELQLHMPV